MEEIEEWRDVKDFEGLYEVSNLGRVRRLPKMIVRNNGVKQEWKTIKIMKNSNDHYGYQQITLCHEGVHLKKKIHRLVAEAFLGDANDLEINHIDGNKSNNNMNNLEIVTRSENTIHAYRVLGRSNNAHLLKTRVLMYSIKNRKSQKVNPEKKSLIREFDGIIDAAKFLKVSQSAVSGCIRGKQKTIRNFMFESKNH